MSRRQAITLYCGQRSRCCHRTGFVLSFSWKILPESTITRCCTVRFSLVLLCFVRLCAWRRLVPEYKSDAGSSDCLEFAYSSSGSSSSGSSGGGSSSSDSSSNMQVIIPRDCFSQTTTQIILTNFCSSPDCLEFAYKDMHLSLIHI